MGVRCRTAVIVLLGATALSVGARAQSSDLASRLSQIGARVEAFYARARSIVCRETVYVQPLKRDLMPDGPPRRLEYELRVSWDPQHDSGLPEARIVRQLVSVNGQPPRPGDEPACTDPRSESPEALIALLPARQHEFVFSDAGRARLDDRDVTRIDYRPAKPKRPTAEWDDDCVSIDLDGQVRARVWADPATGDVLRLDERIEGQHEFPVLSNRAFVRPMTMVVERADTTVRYRPVHFTDPDETVMLPASIETLTVVRNAAAEWLRKTQVFSEHRRFLAAGRVVQ